MKRSSAYKWTVLAILMLGTAILYYSNMIFAVRALDTLSKFNIDEGELAAISTIGCLPGAFLSIIVGRVLDKMDELDLTSAESKATYDEIKAYVLEKHGLKVSSLYISQVKRKCGLDVGQNYNLSKKEDAKVPQCPPEKEAAIMDALKHFQMI